MSQSLKDRIEAKKKALEGIEDEAERQEAEDRIEMAEASKEVNRRLRDIDAEEREIRETSEKPNLRRKPGRPSKVEIEAREFVNAELVGDDGNVIKNKGGKPTVANRKQSGYTKALSLLDKNIVPALQVLIDGLYDENKSYRLKCAELLLKKSLPDKKSKEITGRDGKPIEITDVSNKQIELAIDQVEKLIDRKLKNRPVPGELK